MRISCQPIAQRILQKSLTDLTTSRISSRAAQSLSMYHEIIPTKQLDDVLYADRKVGKQNFSSGKKFDSALFNDDGFFNDNVSRKFGVVAGGGGKLKL